LIIETGSVLEAEKKKMEEKKHKTQKEIEVLAQLENTYKLVDDRNDEPKALPEVKQLDTESLNTPTIHAKDELIEMKMQIQLLIHEKNTLEGRVEQLQSLNQENVDLKCQITEKDTKISTLESVKIAFEYQLEAKDKKINSLENEKRTYHASSLKQAQTLEVLNHENATLEQNKVNTNIEIERLKKSNVTLEQNNEYANTEIKRLEVSNASLQDATMSLKAEIKSLSAANQFMTETMETQKTLLLAKTNEMELLQQNMEHLLENNQRKNDALEQENRALKRVKSRHHQATKQNPSHLNKAHDPNESSHNDINYDSVSDTDESGDDDTNYDTPSENEDGYYGTDCDGTH
jgi:chromosome segregation ATPase